MKDLSRSGVVEVFPELAQAALRAKDEQGIIAWALLRARDINTTAGSGIIRIRNARAVIGKTLGVEHRQVARIVRSGCGKYWDEIPGDRLRIHSSVRVARGLDVHRVGRPHLIPTSSLMTRSGIRAALIATCYRTDDQGVPVTRGQVRELTGVPAATQRRLDAKHRQTAVVTRVIAHFGRQVSQFYADTVAEMAHDWGFFAGREQTLFRRHGDIRTAVEHKIGSSAAQRRLNKALRAERRPATSSRGHRPIRTYFQGDVAVQAWVKDRTARGRSGSSIHSTHPILDHSLVLGSPGPKRHRAVPLSEWMSVSGMSGGSLHRRGGFGLP